MMPSLLVMTVMNPWLMLSRKLLVSSMTYGMFIADLVVLVVAPIPQVTMDEFVERCQDLHDLELARAVFAGVFEDGSQVGLQAPESVPIEGDLRLASDVDSITIVSDHVPTQFDPLVYCLPNFKFTFKRKQGFHVAKGGRVDEIMNFRNFRLLQFGSQNRFKVRKIGIIKGKRSYANRFSIGL